MKKTILDYTLKIRVPITIFVAALAFTLTFYISRSERDGVGYAPEQPIKFSHKLHAGQMNISCMYCHTAVDKARHATLPAAGICMNCHSVARRDKPEIIKLVKYFESGQPIPWKRVHKVPDYAYFNHSVHIAKDIACERCHSQVSGMERITQSQAFTMANCLGCHRKAHDVLPELGDKIKLGPDNCFACHR